jgi:excisionase family DNA binding protein
MPKETRNNDMPQAECPHCGASFQWDDYYDLAAGDERDCPKCDKPIFVTEVEYIMHATLSTEAAS